MNLNTILGFLLFFYFLSIVYYEYIKCYSTDNLMFETEYAEINMEEKCLSHLEMV